MNSSYLSSVRNTITSSKPSKAIRLLLMVFLVLMTSNIASAQIISATTYPVNSTTGASRVSYTSLGTLLGLGKDDQNSVLANIGFDFWFNGTRYTQFGVSANGYLRLGSVSTNTVFTPKLSNSIDDPKITPFFSDLTTGSDGYVKYGLNGTAPNRTLVVEWKTNVYTTSALTNPSVMTFQVLLSETTGKIQFIYGSAMAANGEGYSIGLATSTTNLASIAIATNTASYGSDPNSAQSTAISSGKSYTFTPITPTAPTIGTITQPTCSTATASVVLNGLPSGFWELTRTPGSVVTTGTGISTTISGLAAGTYTYSVNGLSNGLKGEYFNNKTLSDPPVLTRTDATVNFNLWGTGSPDPSINTDGFSVRWSGYVQPQYTELYTFTTRSDDGIKLSVNGVEIITNWTDHGAINNSGTIALTAGVRYDIVLEYYENGGDAVSTLSWSSASQALQIIPTTRLFSTGSYPSPSPATTPIVINTQPTIAAPTGTTAQLFCAIISPTVANLTATGTNIKWYAAAAGGTALPLTTVLVNGAHYYASQTVGCESSTRFDVTATITNPSTPTGTSTQSFCSGTTIASLTATGSNIKWYAASSGGSPLAATTALVNATHYYATQTVSGCESTTRFDVTATVNSTPTITPNKVNESCPTSNNGTISPVLSGGLTNIRYIKLTQKYADYQQVAEIQAFEIFTGANIALSTSGAVATGSSVWLDSAGPNYIASNVNNGVTTGDTFWHSKTNNLNEWVKIDLQSAKNIDYLKIYNRTDCCSTRGQNMLLELFDTSNNLVYSKTIDLYQSGANVIDLNVVDVSWADGASTLNRTALDSGTYTLNYSDAEGCSASAPAIIGATNTTPSAPIPATPTQPNCVQSTGSVVLSALPASGTIYQTGNVVTSYPITGTTMTISGLAEGTYKFAASNGTCTSSITGDVVINAVVTNTWTGTWSQGTPPTPNQKIVFAANYSSTGDVTACSCIVTSGAVIFNSEHTLTLTHDLKVTAGTLTFENTASLVQINDVDNSGDITYKRQTNTSIRNLDYTYWSTPVSPLKLAGAGGISYSSLALTGSIFYSYLVTSTTEDWKSETASTLMVAGNGYSIRGPGPISASPKGLLDVKFTGVPNNGDYSIAIAKAYASYLVGNPYPSAIDADKFLANINNASVLDGTLYFWTHNTGIQDRNVIISGGADAGTGASAYTSNDYAAYNKTGGTASALSDISYPGGKIPTGKIAAGQGFFVTSTVASGSILFNNSMRISGTSGNNSQFFKTKSPAKTTNTVEKNRIWLNLTNTQGAFKQTLVGYITGATNDIDNAFDGESFDGQEFIDFYSINQDKNLTIQGRALPFDENDTVSLGFRSTIEGPFSISIDQVDGSMTSQQIFIEDKLTNIITDLKAGNYTFSTAAGTFDDRFVLRYTNKTLSIDETEKEDGILVLYSNNYKTLIIHNNEMFSTVNSVALFNITGQNITNWELNDSEQTNIQIPIKNISQGIYIVKVKTTKGESNKKIIVR
ncbi:MAG: T9SS type A sorting domain-containing protein [Flavobacterium sp.]|nr:T9SS type A sorting domain-containing protein [Flavobacterium sp.]